MNFLQIQQITMPENVGYIMIPTELIADYCDKSLGHTVFGANWCVNLCMVLYLTCREMCCCNILLLCLMLTY